MRCLLIVLLALGSAAAQPIRQEASLNLFEPSKSSRTQLPTTRVRALIRQLASADPDLHAAAERELLALCPAIEPQLRYAFAEEEKSLPADLPKSSPMHQDYVRGGGFVRFQPADLEPRGAFHSLAALLERCAELRHNRPVLITIRVNDAPLSEIFRQLGQRIDAPVFARARSFDGAVDPAALDWFRGARATVELDRVPYWTALRTILGAIHPPSFRSIELFVDIGSNHVNLASPDRAHPDLFRDADAVSAGPLLLLADYQSSPTPRVIVTAAADPALAGFTGDSSLQLATVVDGQSRSLLPDGDNKRSSGGLDDQDRDPKLGYAYDPADGQILWRRSLPIAAPETGQGVAAVGGTFSIGFGVNAKFDSIGIPLAAFHPEGSDSELGAGSAEERVYLLQDCKVLQSPSAEKPVYEQDHLNCIAHSIERGGGRGDKRTVEGVSLTLTNHRDHAVAYVTGLTYFVDPAPGFPKPDRVVEAVGLYHAHAEPGETVKIQMATTYRAGSRASLPPIPDRIPPEPTAAMPRTVVFDAWRLSVLSVVRVGETYEVTGQLALPALGPFGDAAVGAGYIFVSAVDAQGWQIESYPHFSKLRTEGDRLVEDFKVVTREPGRIPAYVVWQTPSATHWLSAPFTIRNLPELQ